MTSPSDLADRLRTTYHVADLPADSIIRLASDALDELRAQNEALRVENASLRKSEDDAAAHAAECVRLQWAAENQRDAFAALLREAREELWLVRNIDCEGDDSANLIERIDEVLKGGA